MNKETSSKLPLNNPVWQELQVFFGPPQAVPALIRELLEGPFDSQSPALAQLIEAVFHQHSTLSATHTTFPYLLDIAQRGGEQHDRVFFLAANIAASTDLEQAGVPPQLAAAWLAAARTFEGLATERIPRVSDTPGHTYEVCKAALAFAGHACGRLWMDVLEADVGPEGTNRTSVECPGCAKVFDVRLFDEGAVLTKYLGHAEPPQPPHAWALPEPHAYVSRDPNPWQEVQTFLTKRAMSEPRSSGEGAYFDAAIRLCAAGVRPEVPSTDVFCLIGAVLLAHGHAASGRRFLRMLDTLICPSCQTRFKAAAAWSGNQR